MLVSRMDAIGAGIARMGVHELAVSETMWRLAGGDRLALDVGANIGYFTGMLAQRAERVIALEPNPRLERFLAGNVERCELGARVTLDRRAAAESSGTARLQLPAGFEGNYGVATLAAEGGSLSYAAEDSVSYEVPTVRLDEVIAGQAVGVLKIDVEGQELAALRGAGESLAAGLVRDVVFEDLWPAPSPVFELLQSAGFTINGIEEHFNGPRLTASGMVPGGWDAPTYLATRDRERSERLLRARGWSCLRRSAARRR